MKSLKLFLTDKNYRFATIELIRFKIIEGIDSSEKDYSKVREVRSKFTETT